MPGTAPNDTPRDDAGAKYRSLRPPNLFEQEHALLVGGDDVEQAVAVEVGDDELGTDAALVVDLAGGKPDLAVGAATCFEPVEAGGLVGAGLAPAVRPEPLPGHQVLQAVAV